MAYRAIHFVLLQYSIVYSIVYSIYYTILFHIILYDPYYAMAYRCINLPCTMCSRLCKIGTPLGNQRWAQPPLATKKRWALMGAVGRHSFLIHFLFDTLQYVYICFRGQRPGTRAPSPSGPRTESHNPDPEPLNPDP